MWVAKHTKKLVRRHTFGWFFGSGSFAFVNSPGFSLSEMALIVRIISQTGHWSYNCPEKINNRADSSTQ
jgi:hypothetical protein